MLLSEQGPEHRAQPRFRPPAHFINLPVQELDLEARHQVLRQLADLTRAIGELVPLVGLEESELGGNVWGSVYATEMDARHCSRPRIDVGGKQARLAHERIDQAALAGLDLTNDADAAGQAVEHAQRIVNERAALQQRLHRSQLASARDQLRAQGLEPFSDLPSIELGDWRRGHG